MSTKLPPDPTLDEMRDALARELPAHAAFDGWGEAALLSAAAALGIDPGHARLAWPAESSGAAVAMIAGWYGAIDADLAAAFPPERIAAMKIRDRIAALVLARLDLAQPHREAARRALAVLARHPLVATRLGWQAADGMWRLAGDMATGPDHYTKRLTLSGVYGATLLVWLDDDSEGGADTRAFLQRRLADVMRVETFKAKLRPDPERMFSVTRLLGRLRYPAR
jgi:ubiquinone biosynthesis protein COQ9